MLHKPISNNVNRTKGQEWRERERERERQRERDRERENENKNSFQNLKIII